MPEYFWWHGRDLRDFFARVQQLGVDNVRIKFNPETGLLYVLKEKDKDREDDEAEEAKVREQGFNFVHTCPPDCE